MPADDDLGLSLAPRPAPDFTTGTRARDGLPEAGRAPSAILTQKKTPPPDPPPHRSSPVSSSRRTFTFNLSPGLPLEETHLFRDRDPSVCNTFPYRVTQADRQLLCSCLFLPRRSCESQASARDPSREPQPRDRKGSPLTKETSQNSPQL